MAPLQRRSFVTLLSLLGCGVAGAEDWQLLEAMKRDAEAFLERSNGLIEQERFEDAYEDLAPTIKSRMSAAQWSGLQRAIRAHVPDRPGDDMADRAVSAGRQQR